MPSTTPTTTIYLAKSLRRIIYITAVGLGIAFVILPLVALLLAALSGIDSALLNSQTILTATMLSVITTLISTLLMLALGIPLALWMSKSTKLWHKLIQSILTLPIVMPPAVAGLALLLTFGRQGLIGQYTSQLGINIP
ncbi:MAG: molybdate ABC transporter permease subunit, partial [Anaerolineae bacterium]|nr:molybdate ABC transporter permease subunit [Anaerolineae bacterium]